MLYGLNKNKGNCMLQQAFQSPTDYFSEPIVFLPWKVSNTPMAGVFQSFTCSKNSLVSTSLLVICCPCPAVNPQLFTIISPRNFSRRGDRLRRSFSACNFAALIYATWPTNSPFQITDCLHFVHFFLLYHVLNHVTYHHSIRKLEQLPHSFHCSFASCAISIKII